MGKLNRDMSICPTPEETLLESVLKNDCDTIRRVLADNGKLFAHTYSEPLRYENKSIFSIACSGEGVEPKTVQTLLDLGADLDKVEIHTPLIYAALNPNSEILKVILKNLKPGQINNTNIDGNTALLGLIKSDKVEENEDDYAENVKLLLENGMDANKTDSKNMSPILWAAKKDLKRIIAAIIEKRVAHVDLDSHQCPLNKKTARQLILEKGLHRSLPEKMQLTLDLKKKLFALIKERKEDEFLRIIHSCSNVSEIVNENDGYHTFLQYSCEKGLMEATKFLIENHVDVNVKSSGRSPIELALFGDHYDIVDLLFSPATFSPEILPRLIKDYRKQRNAEMVLRSILKKLENDEIFEPERRRIQINLKDGKGNRPLHYAVIYADEEITEKLLKLGASLAWKNDFDRLEVEEMDPEILEKHLNDCIKFEENGTPSVTFDYSSLIPFQTTEIDYQKSESDHKATEREQLRSESDLEKAVEKRRSMQPEMEVIAFMSRTKDFKHLLTHPLIVTFLYMKWHKIRHIYYTNFTFSIVFVLSLLGYVFTRYLYPEDDNSSWGVIFQGLIILSFVILLLRELFQIAVSPRTYFRSVENFIEVILIVVTGTILFTSSASEDTRKILASVAILFAALELFLMVGHHPKLSTNVVMLETVSANFFELLLWYSLLIAAFALSFSILLTKPGEAGVSDGEDDDDQFAGPGKSIFKTIVMLTGEFDAGSINFRTYPIWSKFIFILFVFMITIILLNLLNGLAVSDTQSIKNDAELVGHISRAQHINYVENMAMGNIFPSSIIGFLSNCCCCFTPSSHNMMRVGSLGRKVCLFPEKNFYIKIDCNSGKITSIDEKKGRRGEKKYGLACVGKCMQMELDKDTLNRMNGILKERNREEKTKSELEQVKEKLDKVLKVLEEINNRYPPPIGFTSK